MDVSAYITSYEQFAKRLPSILARWEQISPEQQDGYADELFRLIVRRAEAISLSSDAASFAHIAAADNAVRAWSADIDCAMGFRPVLPLARRPDAQPSRYTLTSLTLSAAAG